MLRIPNFLWKASKKHSFSPAFTIVELLVVIVVIGILAAITIVSYTGIANKASIASLSSDLSNASKQLKLFQIEDINADYPATIDCNGDTSTNKCIKLSPGTVYDYKTDTNPKSFCLTATKNNQSYNIDQDSTMLAGPCPVLKLDASIPLSYPGTGTTWYDLSGNGNDGVLVNGVIYDSSNGGSLHFDGVDDYVRNNRISNITTMGQYSLSAWVYKTSSSEGAIIQNSNSGNDRNGLSISNTTAMIGYYDTYWHGKSGLIALNTWTNIVGTNKNGVLSIFIDGIEQYGSNSPYFSTGSYLYIGQVEISNRSMYLGNIRSLQVYDKSLTVSEIQQNFNAQKGRFGL